MLQYWYTAEKDLVVKINSFHDWHISGDRSGFIKYFFRDAIISLPEGKLSARKNGGLLIKERSDD